MTARDHTLLLAVPLNYAGLWTVPLGQTRARSQIFCAWPRQAMRLKTWTTHSVSVPIPGFLKTLPNLKVVFSLGAGVDGFLIDPEYPKNVPLVRFVDHGLSREMTQYVVHAYADVPSPAAFLRSRAGEAKWRQTFPPRRTEDTRVGILGLGEIGTMAATHLRDLDFQVAGWSRTRKSVAGIESFAGTEEIETRFSAAAIFSSACCR